LRRAAALRAGTALDGRFGLNAQVIRCGHHDCAPRGSDAVESLTASRKRLNEMISAGESTDIDTPVLEALMRAEAEGAENTA